MKVIAHRRSIREFEDKQVDNTTITKILQAAMQAPSAGNQMPWEFLVIKDKETLKKLGCSTPYSRSATKAPLAIIVMANTEHLRFKELWQLDLSACTQNILLEAVSLGLGSTWLSLFPYKDRQDNVRKICNIPEQLQPFSLIPIGYPTKEHPNRFIDRFRKEKVHYENFN